MIFVSVFVDKAFHDTVYIAFIKLFGFVFLY